MGLDTFLDRVIPAVVGYAVGGGPGAVRAAVVTEQEKKAERQQKQRYNQAVQEEVNRRNQMAEFSDSDVIFSGSSMGRSIAPQRAGFGSSFGTFLGDVGRNILNPIGQIFSSPALTPFISAQSRGQPAQPTLGGQMGQETSRSGTQEAFMGGFGNLAGQAARFLRSPAGSVITGTGAGLATGLFGGSSSGVRITRKMKSQYRSVLNLAGGDYALAADMIGVSQDFFIMVMLKRFRNDGPVVTKAALRKTKSTVRRLKSMCDMYDSLRPSATRRKAPMRRASTTLISNK